MSEPNGLDPAPARINSTGYWDDRFLNDWVAMGGRRQTAFFADMICRNLPDTIAEDIRLHDLSIFDVGCALGDALPILQSTFPTSKISGGDVSNIALAIARTLHPNFDFLALGNVQPEQLLADVIYCSNTLEHFDDWSEKLANLAATAAEYLIAAVPFEETDRIAEHVASFTWDTLPPILNQRAQLVCLQIIDTASAPNTMWPGRQLLAVYAQQSAAERLSRSGWLAARERLAAGRVASLQAEIAEASDRMAALNAKRAEYVRSLAQQEFLLVEQQSALDALAAEYEARVTEIAGLGETRAKQEATIADYAARLADQETSGSSKTDRAGSGHRREHGALRRTTARRR